MTTAHVEVLSLGAGAARGRSRASASWRGGERSGETPEETAQSHLHSGEERLCPGIRVWPPQSPQ